MSDRLEKENQKTREQLESEQIINENYKQEIKRSLALIMSLHDDPDHYIRSENFRSGLKLICGVEDTPDKLALEIRRLASK